MLLDGDLKSGGSRANWLTIIPEGTEVEVRNVPEVALWAGDWFEYEIVEKKGIDREELEAEKVKLLARLAEIEALLT